MDERGNGQQGVGCACGPSRAGAALPDVDLIDVDRTAHSSLGTAEGLAVLDRELAAILAAVDPDLAELTDPTASIYDGADTHEERRARQLHAYRDADGALRTRHGLLRLAR